jgi:molecular chaperone HscB
MNPFEVLGIPPRFALDLALVEKRHRELSRAVHPDRFAMEGAGSRSLAAGHAADVNEAWRIVKDPVRRAEALLALAGVPTGDDHEPKPDATLLMQILELREQLGEAKEQGDRAGVTAVGDIARKCAEEAEANLASGLDQTHDDVGTLVRALGALRYYRRLKDEVTQVEDALDGLA